MASYDRAVTIFSPDGHLLQVEYAKESVRKGAAALGIRGHNCIILAVEKRSISSLQEERTIRKICALDDHIIMTFAGFTADGRVLVNRAQVECQSYRLNVEDPVTLEYIARYIAQMKQKYTQSNGRRPFGLSCLIGGFDYDGSAHLYQTEPSGIYHEWKANATGQSSGTVREFLEQNYTDEMAGSEAALITLAIKALLLVVQSGKNNMEIAVLGRGKPLRMLDAKTIAQYVADIEKGKQDAEKKKQRNITCNNEHFEYKIFNLTAAEGDATEPVLLPAIYSLKD
uniref:Proteasome subunit alpha type n=1 Tax=Glossina pallidipes TaxID=7398 RepID=A0A1B0AGI3_GLOPL